MAIMKITMKGTPVLHARAAEVEEKEFGTPELKKLVEDMVETMYDAHGVGIAATQVGLGKRIFIAESDHGPIALINPEFTKTSWKLLNGEEGCLSIPGKFDRLKRHKSVTIKGRTVDGAAIEFAATGFFARILQHELDHLDGKLYVDRVAEQKGTKD
jgi:peptide deformylase